MISYSHGAGGWGAQCCSCEGWCVRQVQLAVAGEFMRWGRVLKVERGWANDVTLNSIQLLFVHLLVATGTSLSLITQIYDMICT